MDEKEEQKLEEIHNDVREVRRDVSVLEERTARIDDKTDRVDKRVFGRDGIEDSVQENSQKISRLQSAATIVIGAATTITAKVMNIIP